MMTNVPGESGNPDSRRTPTCSTTGPPASAVRCPSVEGGGSHGRFIRPPTHKHEDYSPALGRPRDLTASGHGCTVGRRTPERERRLSSVSDVPPGDSSIRQTTGHCEICRILHPRSHVAARLGYLREGNDPRKSIYEAAVGFRPNVYQLIKVGYQGRHNPGREGLASALAVQGVPYCGSSPLLKIRGHQRKRPLHPRDSRFLRISSSRSVIFCSTPRLVGW